MLASLLAILADGFNPIIVHLSVSSFLETPASSVNYTIILLMLANMLETLSAGLQNIIAQP